MINKITKKEILNGELSYLIRVDDSSWTISDGRVLTLLLEKYEENIWECVLVGDEKIDTSKVDNSKKLEEFDAETQSALRKVMYE